MPAVELLVNVITYGANQMTRVDEINAQIAKLQAERESEMLKERANVLAKMKADIKLYGFKTTDFKGVLATRKKRGTGTAAKKATTKKTTKWALIVSDNQVDINQVLKDLFSILRSFAENRDAIQVLTLTKGYKSLFKLKDDEWVTFSKMDISVRPVFEKAMENEIFLEEVKRKLGD